MPDPTPSEERAGPVRVVVVDDEKWARRRVEQLVAEADGFEVVATAEDGLSGADAVVRERPDVVFLDVQMPGADGFEALRRFRGAGGVDPVVVFVTAYDEHAVRAFDERALDYLLKPYSDDRFDEALARAVEHLDRARLAKHRAALAGLTDPAGPASAPASTDRFVYKDGTHYGLLDPTEIEWAEAQDVYVCLHTAGGADVLIREPLYSVEERLPAGAFVRVHRSALVNVDRVVRVVPARQGRATLHMAGGDEVPMSRTYREDVMAVLRDGLERA